MGREMVTVKGTLTDTERRRLEAAHKHAAEVNGRERDANFRGLAAGIAIAQAAKSKRK
jgi:hypothetical protein